MVMLILRRKKLVSDRKRKIAKKECVEGKGLARNRVHPFYGNRTQWDSTYGMVMVFINNQSLAG